MDEDVLGGAILVLVVVAVGSTVDTIVTGVILAVTVGL